MTVKEHDGQVLKALVSDELYVWIAGQAKRDGVIVSVWVRRLLLREQAESKSHARAQDIVDLIDLLMHEHIQQSRAEDAPDGPAQLSANDARLRLNILRGNLRASILQAIRYPR